MRRITAAALPALALLVFAGWRTATSAEQPKSKSAKAKTHVPGGFGNSEAISENDMRIYEYFLASDQLEGRNLPSRGYDTAALFVASNLAEWGLKPGGSTGDTNGPLQPYFMPFELISKQIIPDESKVSVTGPAGRGGRGGPGGPAGQGGGNAPTGGQGARNGGPRTTSFEYGKDWTITVGRRGGGIEPFDLSGNLVFAGNGYVINKTKIDPFQNLDVKGKIVVVAGIPAELAAQQNATDRAAAQAANPLGEECTDFMTPEQAAAKNGALAVVHVASFQQLTAMNEPNAGGGFGGGGFGPAVVGRPSGPNGPAYQVAKFKPQLACPVVPSITAGLALTSAIFAGEKRTAEQIFAAALESGKQEPFALAAEKKVSLRLGLKSEPGHAENVVAMLEGCDPVKKNEYVVISAHLDHIGLSANVAPGAHNINNGADDDGSGSTALLAIAHAYVEGAAKGVRPDRTIIFLWNAGEEKGLWGSQYFAEFPPVDLSKVVADLNIDMIGRTKGPDFKDSDQTHVLVSPGEIMLVGPNVSSNDLEKTIESVNNGYQKLTLNHFYDATAPDKTHDNLGPQPRGQRIFYRSDHYNFAKVGIPIVFFTTGLHPDYHRPTDTPDKLDFHEMLVVSKTISAVAWELAQDPGRPKLNETLPDQLKKDMKAAQDQGWGKVTPILTPLPGEPF
ncbi:MAG TPA: M28 family peptidase [Bryobacteraceae bacterium]|nr:M28 family peptidase [Bryobacteraceae bacterium]